MRINYHYCADCDIAWEDEWECACDDECPGCRRDFTPFDSEEERDAAQKVIDVVNDYAVSRILRRTIDMYDQRRAWFPQELESVSRELAVDWLSRTARIDDIRAAELIADRLASRATKRLGEHK
jgi:hypothetical protein